MGSPDTTAPYITKISPAWNAKEIAIASDIVIDFSEPVVYGSGSIQLVNGTGESLKMSANDKQLTLNGSTLTINPSVDLVPGSSYAIYIDTGFVKDEANNFLDYTKSFFYSVADSTGKVVTGTVNPPPQQVPPTGQPGGPPPGAALGTPDFGSGVAVNAFNRLPVGKVSITGVLSQGQYLSVTNNLSDADGVGPITYQWYSGNTIAGFGSSYVVAQSDVNKRISVKATYVDGLGKTESVSSDLSSPVIEGALIASNENSLKLIKIEPAEYSTKLPIDTSIVLTFNKNIQLGTGGILIKNGVDGSVYSAASSLVTSNISIKNNVLKITPSTDYEYQSNIRLTFEFDSIRDGEGNIYRGHIEALRSTVSEPETKGPKIVNFNPADGNYSTSIKSDIVITFNEEVKRGNGLIIIKKLDGQVVESFGIKNSNVNINGKTVTIDPVNYFNENTEYLIEFEPGSILNIQGIDFSGTKRYNFKTGYDQSYSGAVKIGGIATQGQKLTASNDLNDPDGIGSLKYEWYLDGVNTKITGQDYYLKQKDVGGNLTVQATYKDNTGKIKVVLSDAVNKITNANDKPDLINITHPGQKIIDQLYDTGGICLQTDGKILVVGRSSSLNQLTAIRINENGSSDKSFQYDVKLEQNESFSIEKIVQSPDGKIIIIGYLNTYSYSPSIAPTSTLRLIQLNNDGSRDVAFSGDGILDLGDGYKGNELGGINIDFFANSEIILSARKGYDFIDFYRINSTGVVDSKFNQIISGLNDGEYFYKVSQDKFILMSNLRLASVSDNHYKFITEIRQYWVNGEIDESFKIESLLNDGIDLTKAFGINLNYGSDGSYYYISTQQSGDDIDFRVNKSERNSSGMVVALISANEGKYTIQLNLENPINKPLDNGFGNNGFATVDIAPYDSPAWGRGTLIQSNGKILAAGQAHMSSDTGTQVRAALARFNADGTLDQDFGISPQDNGSVSYTEGGSAVVLNPLVQVEDLDYQAAGTYAGATLTLKRHGGVNAQDTFSLSTQGTSLNVLANNDITNNGQVIGTFKSEAGTLSLAFKGAGATQTVVNQVLQHIQYKNMAFAPPANVQIDWTFSDGTATETGLSNVTVIDLPNLGASLAKHWKEAAKTPTDTKKADAVNLTDAIAILKMIVGLNVNSNNTPLSPYQAIAADFDQSGDVGLTDAIGVLKMVVGLSAPTPTWKYYDDTKLSSAYTSAQSLSPKAWTTTSVISDNGTADSSVKLIGVLTGDVDGSWTGV